MLHRQTRFHALNSKNTNQCKICISICETPCPNQTYQSMGNQPENTLKSPKEAKSLNVTTNMNITTNANPD